ncbi:hypothetical protein G647_10026 [Cladophialophora carrionii CBS 160.54]|uniref:Uncharacterized protein n=1 Tax=Cladophialophora carrionii CBS 160.54 TaxID=1279043 RepID=V9DLV5_9EURO|nr:uncharacterized protein G647_10026 [Cladophialophora carrionii CBS 160.54]ETI26927.1 hypothetical protein G647_10026 [Cladophialophora carrionii CBS 160.54]
MSLSAEGVVKKRGRPRKNAVVQELDGHVDAGVVLEGGSSGFVSSRLMTTEPKTKTKMRGKGKIEAKKSASASAPASTSTSTAASSPPPPILTSTTPSSASKRKPKSLVEDAGLADAVDEPHLTATTAVKTVAGTKSRGKTASKSSDVKKQDTVSVRDPTSPRRGTPKGQARVEYPAVVSSSLSSSSQEEGTAPVLQPETSHLSQTSTRDISISKILQQAKAFSTHSTQLQQGILAFVDKRERECEALVSPSLTQPFTNVEIQGLGSHLSPSTAIAGSLPSTVPAIDSAVESSSSASTSTHLPPSPSQPQPQPPPPQPHPLGTMPLPPPQFKSAAATAATTGSAPQIRAYSSTSPLPMSTTVALAARGSQSQSRTNLPPPPPTPHPASEPRHPLPFSPPSAVPIGPRPPKLSEMPLEQRKKDPRYRKATVRYTAAIVALPFAIVTSYLLWEKCMCLPLFSLSVALLRLTRW